MAIVRDGLQKEVDKRKRRLGVGEALARDAKCKQHFQLSRPASPREHGWAVGINVHDSQWHCSSRSGWSRGVLKLGLARLFGFYVVHTNDTFCIASRARLIPEWSFAGYYEGISLNKAQKTTRTVQT